MSNPPVYTVAVLEEAPWVSSTSGKPSGHVVELLQLVADRAGFKTDLRLTNHTSYGHKDYALWRGLISETSDIIAGPLPTTMDIPPNMVFSKPFQSSGTTFLIKYPEPPTLTSIHSRQNYGISLLLEPFATEVWVMVVLTYIAVSLALFLIGRYSPYEVNRVAKDKEGRHARSNFGLKNSFLFTASTMGWQGYKEAPRSISGRILMCMWFFFTVCVLLAYTAGLCSLLTMRGQNSPHINDQTAYAPFDNVQDLLERKLVKVGAVQTSHVRQLLHGQMMKEAPLPNLYDYIEGRKEWIQNQAEGVQRVQESQGTYALLMDKAKADYAAQGHCDLVTYTTDDMRTHQTFMYGFAFKSTFPMKGKFNDALTKLKEDGTLYRLTTKYATDSTKDCPPKAPLVSRSRSSNLLAVTSSVVTRLDMQDMGVAFLYVFLGIVGAGLALGAELYYVTHWRTTVRHWIAKHSGGDEAVREPLNNENIIVKVPKAQPPQPPRTTEKIDIVIVRPEVSQPISVETFDIIQEGGVKDEGKVNQEVKVTGCDVTEIEMEVMAERKEKEKEKEKEDTVEEGKEERAYEEIEENNTTLEEVKPLTKQPEESDSLDV